MRGHQGDWGEKELAPLPQLCQLLPTVLTIHLSLTPPTPRVPDPFLSFSAPWPGSSTPAPDPAPSLPRTGLSELDPRPLCLALLNLPTSPLSYPTMQASTPNRPHLLFPCFAHHPTRHNPPGSTHPLSCSPLLSGPPLSPAEAEAEAAQVGHQPV